MAKLLVIGVGAGLSKRYLVDRLVALGHDLAVFAERLPGWFEPSAGLGLTVDLGDTRAAVAAAARLDDDHGVYGVLTFDEAYVELTAEIAQALALPGLSLEAARRCRDKHAMRRRLAEAGVPSARSVIAETLDDALGAAGDIGYPVVLKPRNLGGSIGVVRADGPADVRSLFEVSAAAVFDRISTLPGLLVEEFLDGPEFSVESVVDNGVPRICAVTEKVLGFAPYFEETGHFSRPFDATRDAGIGRLVCQVHEALGINLGATHCELRVTPTGPRVIEIGARLAGDRIPELVRRATGIDLIAAAADAAAGKPPAVEATDRRVAGIRMLYPRHDGVVVRLDATGEPPAELGWYAKVGQRVALPPRGFLARLGYLSAVAPDREGVVRLLDESEDLLAIEVDPEGEDA
ncbi:MAG TPA: ATP-grasp domain-containing protein [Thermoleophilia bacterium]|nr:ATP-grasp domain-containing protein [Thermoleophilia bacterium]